MKMSRHDTVPNWRHAVVVACLGVAVSRAHTHARSHVANASAGVPTFMLDAHADARMFREDEEGGGHSNSHSCIHDFLSASLDSMDAHAHKRPARQLYATDPVEAVRPGRRMQSTYSPIRITADTSRLAVNAEPLFGCYTAGLQYQPTLATSSTQRATCQASDVLSAAQRTYLINTVIPAAIQWFSDSLAVLPVSGNLILNNPIPDDSCCNDAWGVCNSFVCCESHFPSADRTNGIAATDFRLYVTARPTGGSTIAWALTCQSDQYGRPIAGHINFNPSRVSTLAEDFPSQLSTSVHELMHALGFSSSNFWMWRRPGSMDTASPSDVIGTTSELGRTVRKIITPNVVSAVKAQFDCLTWTSSLAGMELEDFGGSGTAGSHWEKRLLFNEVMTGTADPNSVYSSITLAAFADMGWYSVSYTRAQRLPWGNGEGCSFVQNQCNSWNSRYFCTVASQGGCTPDMRYRASCNLFDAPFTLPSANQYFSGFPNRGGSNPFVDYCPIFARLSNGDCWSSNTVGLWFYGETVGSTSRCFSGTYQRASISATPAQHGGCLTASCTLSNFIEVSLTQSGGRLTVLCPRNGGSVNLATLSGSQFTGTLDCPPASVMCTGNPCDSNTCSNRGTCNPSDGTCACNSGFYGATPYDCANRFCPLGQNATVGNMTECAGNAACDKATGRCLDETGQPGCFAGWADGPLGACSRRGCPLRASSACNTTNGICECAGRGSCSSAGLCNCTAGFIGNDCGLTDCPGTPRCSGSESGTCDGARGFCECVDAFDGNALPQFYTGPGCEQLNNGQRPFIRLAFVGEVDAMSNTTAAPYTGVLRGKEYTYFSFQVPTTQFPITLRLTLTGSAVFSTPAATAAGWTANMSTVWVEPLVRTPWYQNAGMTPVRNAPAPVLVAGYASSGRPTARSATFTTTAVDSVTATYTIVFSSSGAENAFTQIGTMNVGVLAPIDAFFSLSLTRDGCAALNCSRGTCVNGACVCPRASEAAMPSRSYGWSGVLCNIADCPGSPDCGGDSRGVCVAPADRTSLPFCDCHSSYSGERCQSLNRDRTSTREFGLDSNDVVDRSGFMVVTYYAPDANGNMSVSSVPVYNASWSGSIDVGRNVTPVVIDPASLVSCCGMNGTLSVYARLTLPGKNLADAMLVGLDGDYPTLSLYSQFDLPAWRAHASTHEIAVALTTRPYFLTVFNGRYAQEALQYSLYVEVASGDCAPSLNRCNGNGFCQSGLCRCNPGWEGLACNVPAPRIAAAGLPFGINTPLSPGEWTYYVHELNGSTAELSIRLTRTGSARAAPLLVAAAVSAPGASSLARLTSELALFDFDSYSTGAVSQTIQFRREDTTAFKLLYIGVHNLPSARATLSANLTLTALHRYSMPLCSGTQVTDANGVVTQLPSNATCDSAFCRGRGTYELSNSASGLAGRCRCDFGWNSLSYCTSPSFGSFEFFAAAAQDIDFLCSVCQQPNITLGSGGLALYSIPQPLQKSTGLRLDVVAVRQASSARSRLLEHADSSLHHRWQGAHARALDVSAGITNGSSVVALGNPSLLVAATLPRSILDFIYISNSASSNETIRIDRPSPSGKYWVAVYANTPGGFRIAAARQTFGVIAVPAPSFASQLAEWFTRTTGGIVVLAFGGALLLCVCASCWLQQCAPSCTKKNESQLAQEDAIETAKRDLFKSVRTLHAKNASPAATIAAIAASSRRIAAASNRNLLSSPAATARVAASQRAVPMAPGTHRKSVTHFTASEEKQGGHSPAVHTRSATQGGATDDGMSIGMMNPLVRAHGAAAALSPGHGTPFAVGMRSPGARPMPAEPRLQGAPVYGAPSAPPMDSGALGGFVVPVYSPASGGMLVSPQAARAHLAQGMPPFVLPLPGMQGHAYHMTPGFLPTAPLLASQPGQSVVVMDAIPAPPARVNAADTRTAEI